MQTFYPRFDFTLRCFGSEILTLIMGGALGAAGFVSLMSIGVTNENYTIENVEVSYIGMTVLAGLALFIVIFLIKRDKKEVKETTDNK